MLGSSSDCAFVAHTLIQYFIQRLHFFADCIPFAQNKWVDSLVDRYMQFVMVGIVLPVGMQQNMNTGLIPLSGVRFAIATSLPAQDDAIAWVNPCYSSDGASGMMDTAVGWKNLYESAAREDCALNKPMCRNPTTAFISPSYVEFFFPIGDNAINEMHINSVQRYYLFISFDVSVTDSAGKVSSTKLSAQAPITQLSVSKSCESLKAEASMAAVTKIDLAIGFVTNDDDWSSSMRVFADVTQTDSQSSSVINAATVSDAPVANSLQSGLITLVVGGIQPLFSSPATSQYSIVMEELTSLHFLDNDRFQTVQSMLDTGEAYDMVTDTITQKPAIQLKQAVWDVCRSGVSGDFSCAIRADVKSRVINVPYAVHSLSGALGVNDTAGATKWLTDNLLGGGQYSQDRALNFTNLVRSKYAINDGMRKAWMINPGFNWPVPNKKAQSILQLSDKTIFIAVFTINDAGGNVLRRRLMSVVSDGATVLSRKLRTHPRKLLALEPPSYTTQFMDALHKIQDSPRSGTIPPISNNIDRELTMAAIYEKTREVYKLLSMQLVARFDAQNSYDDICAELTRRIYSNYPRFCANCTTVYFPFCNIRRVVGVSNVQVNLTGFFVFGAAQDNTIIYSELFRSIVNSAYTTIATGNLTAQGLQAYITGISLNQFIPVALLAEPSARRSNATIVTIDTVQGDQRSASTTLVGAGMGVTKDITMSKSTGHQLHTPLYLLYFCMVALVSKAALA